MGASCSLARGRTSASCAVVLAGYRTGCRVGSGEVTEGQAGARTGVEAAVTAARQSAGSARAEEGHGWPGGVEAQEVAGLMFGRSGVAVPGWGAAEAETAARNVAAGSVLPAADGPAANVPALAEGFAPAADSRPVAVVVHCWKIDHAPGSPAAGLANFGG